MAITPASVSPVQLNTLLRGRGLIAPLPAIADASASTAPDRSC
jgi:hypothetical protein